MKYDLAIIGGGPGGYNAAAAAAKEGLKVILFEKAELGGTCLNRGCIPTKAMIHTAEIWSEMNNADESGLHADKLSYRVPAIHRRKNNVVATLRSGVEMLMKSSGVTVINGTAQVVGEGKVLCNNETYEAKDILIAAGSVPAKPPIPGIDLPGVFSSNEVLEGNGKTLASMIIIGGGVIGVEIAGVYAALGCKVTILEAMDRLLPPMDAEIAQRLTVIMKKRGIAVNTKAMVSGIADGGEGKIVTFKDKNGAEQSVTAMGVLVCTGRRACVAGIFSDNYCPDMERGAIVADELGRTSLPHLYVIGDAKARNIQLAHVAEAQGRNIAAFLSGKTPHMDMSVVPSCVYTSPEIASVGLTEAQAKEAGYAVTVGKCVTGANGKCVIEGGENGYVKLVADSATGVLLGAQLVYPRATDIIGELTLAVQKKLTVKDLASVIHPHPTFCEGILAAAESMID
ncbi:MAG: dihydrolipoyl dehydrogenase [Clostridia bacterium]|nr:dihydrolipoyl dehydrogenase [Clostridia bacterium]